MAPPNRRVIEVWIGNTDGKEIVEQVENRPDDAQLKGVKKDGTPNISDGVLNIFRQVESKEKVSKEWRTKLGELLFHDMRKKFEGDHATDRQREILGTFESILQLLFWTETDIPQTQTKGTF